MHAHLVRRLVSDEELIVNTFCRAYFLFTFHLRRLKKFCKTQDYIALTPKITSQENCKDSYDESTTLLGRNISGNVTKNDIKYSRRLRLIYVWRNCFNKIHYNCYCNIIHYTVSTINLNKSNVQQLFLPVILWISNL